MKNWYNNILKHELSWFFWKWDKNDTKMNCELKAAEINFVLDKFRFIII